MEEDHSQSECEEFMEDFFEPTLSKVKEVEDLHEKHLAKARWPLYCPLTTVCMCMSHRQMDEAIGAEFNGFEWVQVHATGLAKPNVLSAWFKIFAAHTVETGLQCVGKARGRGRRDVPGGAISQLTHSGTRCP